MLGMVQLGEVVKQLKEGRYMDNSIISFIFVLCACTAPLWQ